MFYQFELQKILRKDHFVKRDSFVTVPSSVTYSGNLENSRCFILKTKDATELETCKKTHFYIFLHLVTIKNLAGAVSFGF